MSRWTGGQYSLMRLVLALIAIAFVARQALGGTAWALVAVGLVAALALALGRFDRLAALALAASFAVEGGSGAIDPPWVALAIAMMLHALAAPAPYGSLAAIDRPDPGGGWRLARGLAVAWPLALALWLGVAAWHHETLRLPLALLAVAVALPWTRGVGWTLSLLLHLAALADPAWRAVALAGLALHAGSLPLGALPPRRPDEREWLFYDGSCGLCHRAVRFVLAEDPQGQAFRFASLDSTTADVALADLPRPLPDSVAVLTADGRLLLRSSAVVHIALALGGIWRLLGALLWLVPRPLRDLAYRGLAAVRYRLFDRPEQACPVVPQGLRDRFGV